MKQTFLIDVDGTVAALVEYTLHKLGYLFDRDTLPKPADLKGHHDLFKRGKTLLTDDQLLASHKLLASKGYVQHLPLILGAVESIDAIRAAGHNIQWITASWTSSETWDYDRRTWLRKQLKVDPIDVGFFAHKELVDGDIFIDDKPDHIIKWQRKHPNGRALLYTQPWNEGAEDNLEPGDKPLERFTWHDTERLLKELT